MSESSKKEETEDLYQVVFAGNITGDFSRERTKQRFGKAFKLPMPRVERIFSGAEITLKKNMTEAKAMDFAVKLAEIGCETFIEMMPTGAARPFAVSAFAGDRARVPSSPTEGCSPVVARPTWWHWKNMATFPATP